MPRRPHETAVTKKLETYFTYKLDLIKSEAVRQVNELYRKELGLVVRDLRVLRQIGDAPGISVSALQAATFIEKPCCPRSCRGSSSWAWPNAASARAMRGRSS